MNLESLLIDSVSYTHSEKQEQFWADACYSELGQGGAGPDKIWSVTGERSHNFFLGRVI